MFDLGFNKLVMASILLAFSSIVFAQEVTRKVEEKANDVLTYPLQPSEAEEIAGSIERSANWVDPDCYAKCTDDLAQPVVSQPVSP